MLTSLTSRFHTPSRITPEPPVPLHGQEKAPQLNQIADSTPKVGLASSLAKLGSTFKGMFRARQRDVGKHEQRAWHEPLMRKPQDGSDSGLQMVNSSAAHAITQKLNAEGSYKDVRALLAHEVGTGVEGYLLRDQDDHYHQVQQSAALISTLKSSQPMATRPDPAGKGHQSESSGIYTDHQNQQFTLHDNTLYRFDKTAQRWAREQPGQDGIARLSLDHAGKLICYPRNGELRDQSSTSTHVAQLLRDGQVRLAEQSDLEQGFKTRLCNADGEPLQVSRVGLLPPTNGRATLFALDKQGQLHHVRLPQQLSPQRDVRLQPVKLDFQSAVGATPAQHAALEGFISDRGRLKAVLRDGTGLRHACPLPRPRASAAHPALATLAPGWRLSEQMHLVNRTGLPERIANDDVQVRLHGGAALGLNKSGELCGWNETTQHWDKLPLRGVTQLTRGLDDKAYVVQHGKLHALKANFEHPTLTLAHGDAVALGRATVAQVGDSLGQQSVSQCAVLDEQHFAALTQPRPNAPARLTASLQGLAVDIPLPRDSEGTPLPITSIALDQAKHLYVSARGNLYRLPHDQWTQTQQGATAKWTPAGLQAGATPVPFARPGQGLDSVAEHDHAGDGIDLLKDKIRASAAPLLPAGANPAHVEIGDIAMGPNNRPVLEARLHQAPPPTGGTSTQRSRPLKLKFELSYDRQGTPVLHLLKGQANPATNRHWETLQAQNHTTQKIGNANGSASTTLFGATTDNVRVDTSRNIFSRAAEALRKIGDAYQHHFHPVEAPKASVQGLQQAVASAGGIKQGLQAAVHHALTSGARSRAGLTPLYRESQRLYQSFKTPTVMADKPALAERLARLASAQHSIAQEERARLHRGLLELSETAQDSSYHAIVRLGQLHGLLDGRGLALHSPSPTPARAGAASVMADALRTSGLPDNDKARAKLDELINLGLKLPDRRFDGPLDNTGRNKSPSSLLQDRILLNAQALHQVGDLLERVLRDGTATRALSHQGSTSLDQLQGLRIAYENSDIKLFSDNGIVSHAELEKLQEARDIIARELSGKHGLNYNTTRSFCSDLKTIGDHFGNLQLRDATTLLRSKAAALTSPTLFLPMTPDGGGLFINFGVVHDHAVSLETEGAEDTTWLGLKNARSNSGFFSVGYYHAPSAVVTRLLSDNPSALGKLYAADINPSATKSHSVTGWLGANQASMANVMENLLDPSASLAGLYRLGQERRGAMENVKGHRQEIAAMVGFDLGRLSLGGSVIDDQERGRWNMFLRATGGAFAEATLLENTKLDVTAHEGLDLQALVSVKDLGALTSAKASAYARVGMANMAMLPGDTTNSAGVKNDKNVGLFSLADVLNVSVSLDRAKNREFELVFMPGKAVTTPQLQDMENALHKVLQDPVITAALSERQQLLQALQGCIFPPLATSLNTSPRGGSTPPSAPTGPRPGENRQAALRALLPRLQASLPQQAHQVTALQQAMANLPAAANTAERDQVMRLANELAVAMAGTTLTNTSTQLRRASQAIAAGQPLADLAGHLQTLQRAVKQLDQLPVDHAPLRELRHGLQQLAKQNTLASTGRRMLGAAECKVNDTGVHMSKGGFAGESAAWRSNTSVQNAQAVVAFINQQPLLREMARRAERMAPTAMEVTMELLPAVLERLEASLNSQDPDLRNKLEAALRDTENVRIKRFTLLRSATQTSATSTPPLLVSARSSASFSDAVVLASMDLKYGHEQQHQPIGVTPSGLLLQPRVSKAVRDDLDQQQVSITGSLDHRAMHTSTDDTMELPLPDSNLALPASSAANVVSSSHHDTSVL